jgi:hypothetical protein
VAVDPNTYLTRNRALSAVMALFNIRTGYWAPNPNPKYYKKWRRKIFPTIVPTWIFAIVKEMLGHDVNEKKPFIHLWVQLKVLGEFKRPVEPSPPNTSPIAD